MLRQSLIFISLAMAGSALSQTGWYRVRVNVPDALAFQRLQDSGLNLMECNPHLGTTDLAIGPGDAARLLIEGFTYTYVGEIKNPHRLTKSQATVVLPQDDDYRLHYFNADQILGYFEALRAQYPNIVTRRQIGVTINGEPHWAYRVGRQLQEGTKPFNNIMVQGLIHAREWISGSVIMHVAKKCVEGLTTPQQTPFMSNQAVWIIPMTNPDGYRYTWTDFRLWRKNRRNNGSGSFGVDLNRNYSKGWGGEGSSGNKNSETYRGTAPFSEPETANIRDLALTLPRIGGMVDFHSYGELILWPWGYTETPPPDASLLNNIGTSVRNSMNAFGGQYIQGQCSTTLYLAAGGSIDYFYNGWTAPSFTVELRDTGEFGFELPESQIFVTQDEAWAGFKKLLTFIPR